MEQQRRKIMKPQTMNIIKMISKPVSQRMPFQGVQLTKFVQKLTFFKRYFPYQSQKFISLCLSSTLMTFNQGDYLYQNEPLCQANNIYILIDGSLEVKSKQNPSCRIINTYDIIGHVQVIFKLQKRFQKVKCLSEIHCMIIKGENFYEVWEYEKEINKSYNYIKSNKYFEELTDFNKKYLCLFMIKNMFKSGQVLIQSNAVNDKIIFIIYGEVLVTRKLRVKNHKEKESEKEVVLESLQEMDSFGEFQAINKLVNQVSLRAASSGMYYTVNIGELLEINHPILKIMQEKGMPYPDKEELEFRFSVQSEVEKFKNQIKKNLRLYQ